MLSASRTCSYFHMVFLARRVYDPALADDLFVLVRQPPLPTPPNTWCGCHRRLTNRSVADRPTRSPSHSSREEASLATPWPTSCSCSRSHDCTVDGASKSMCASFNVAQEDYPQTIRVTPPISSISEVFLAGEIVVAFSIGPPYRRMRSTLQSEISHIQECARCAASA